MPRKRSPATSNPDGKLGHADLIREGPPLRLERALYWLTPRRGKPGLCYVDTRDKLVAEFGCSAATAELDLKRAYEVIKSRLAATDLPSVIRTEMEALARAAADRGDRAVASVTWFRLGRLSGLTDESDETQARKLSDQALDAAIRASLAMRVESMSTEELEDVLRRRRASEGVATITDELNERARRAVAGAEDEP